MPICAPNTALTKPKLFKNLEPIRAPRLPGQNPGNRCPSSRLAAASDNLGEARNRRRGGHVEPSAEVVPERDPELAAGLGEAEEGIATVTTEVGFGATADMAFGHLAADVVLRSVGVQRDLRAVEHCQQLGLVGMQPRQQPIEADEAGAAHKDAVEARPQLAAPTCCWCGTIGLEVGIEPPDQAAHLLLGGALLVSESLQLVHQPLGMDPAERVIADVELAGIVTDDHRLVEEAMLGHRPP